MFLQYVDHGILHLTGDFMAQLLKGRRMLLLDIAVTLMNFNKTEAAIFHIQAMLSEDFLFLRLI